MRLSADGTMRGFALGPREVRWRPRYDPTALALVAVVVSFVAATTFTERRMGRITSASRKLSDACFPAVVEASRMHGDLARLESLFDTRGSGPAQAEVLARLDDGRRRVSALPLSVDAQQEWAGVQDDLVALRREISPVVQEESGVPGADERPGLVEHILSIGGSLDKIIASDRERAAAARRDVESARAWTGRISSWPRRRLHPPRWVTDGPDHPHPARATAFRRGARQRPRGVRGARGP